MTDQVESRRRHREPLSGGVLVIASEAWQTRAKRPTFAALAWIATLRSR